MNAKHSEEELAMQTPAGFQVWKLLVSYVAPAAVFLVFLHVIGVL